MQPGCGRRVVLPTPKPRAASSSGTSVEISQEIQDQMHANIQEQVKAEVERRLKEHEDRMAAEYAARLATIQATMDAEHAAGLAVQAEKQAALDESIGKVEEILRQYESGMFHRDRRT
jgi:DNA-directed RNA polymerase beta' subunit